MSMALLDMLVGHDLSALRIALLCDLMYICARSRGGAGKPGIHEPNQKSGGASVWIVVYPTL
jgi:hypothetical protein